MPDCAVKLPNTASAAEALRARLRLSFGGRSRKIEFWLIGVLRFVRGGVGNATRYAHGKPAVSQTLNTFVREFRAFQRGVLFGGIGAAIAFVGLIYSILPLAPAFRQFFRGQIGGNLGECLLGASLPLAASPPVLLYFVWLCKRSNRPALKCVSCNHSFASHPRFVQVSNTGRCPACDAVQFPVIKSQSSDRGIT